MVKILITTIQVNFGCRLVLAQNSPELSLLNFFTINLPSEPFLGRHLGFHIFFHHSLFEGRTLFLQLGCFGLDFTSFCICIPPSWPMASFGAFLIYLYFLFHRKEEKMKQMNILNISDFINKCTNYIYIYIYMYMLYYRYCGTRNIYQKIYKLRKDVIVRGEASHYSTLS